MVLNKTKGTICAVILLGLGYLGGAYLGSPKVDIDKLGGDIGKAKLYNNAGGGFANADTEKLMNDTAYQQDMSFSALLLSSRVALADSIVNASLAVTGGIETLSALNNEMQNLAEVTKNAKTAFVDLLGTMNGLVSKGGDNGGGGATGGGGDNGGGGANGGGGNYEQQLNNALLAYSVVENAMGGAPLYTDLLLEYGKTNGNDDVLALAGGWLQYGAENAVFGGNETEIKEWQGKYEAAGGIVNGGLGAFPSINLLFSRVQIDHANNLLGLASKELNSVMLLANTKMSALGHMSQMSSLQKMQNLELGETQMSAVVRNSATLNSINTLSPVGYGLRAACMNNMAGLNKMQAGFNQMQQVDR